MTQQIDSKERALTQLEVMLNLQNAMNSKVNASWQEQGFQWYRAIWVECAEMLDHFGWKWWKHQDCDLDQVKLELVDIFHFGLSLQLSKASPELIKEEQFNSVAANILEKMLEDVAGESSFPEALEMLAGTALTEKAFDIAAFQACLKAINFSLDELYRMYIGKNTLNFFRQDHGYKDGTYKKTWQGKEDNEHLAEIINELDSSDKDFPDNVYHALAGRYAIA